MIHFDEVDFSEGCSTEQCFFWHLVYLLTQNEVIFDLVMLNNHLPDQIQFLLKCSKINVLFVTFCNMND